MPLPTSSNTVGNKKLTPRRPHTSAGPRDKPYGFVLTSTDDTDAVLARRRQTMESRLNSAHDDSPAVLLPTPTSSNGGLGNKMITIPRLRASSSNTSGTSTSEGSNSEPEPSKIFEVEAITLDQTQVLAWEEELARIEMQSRRSSMDMLGSIYRRRQVSGQEAN